MKLVGGGATFERAGLVGVGLLAAAVLGLALTGCGAAPAQDQAPASSAETATSQAVDVPVAPTTKTVTFPATYFQYQGASEQADVEELLEGLGAFDIVANEDGSYTATMESEVYTSLVETVYDQVIAAIDGLVDDEAYPGVVAVDYDEQFVTVTVTFDDTSIAADDELVARLPGNAANVYQQLAGLPVECTVILVGSDGSELLSTTYTQS